MVEAAARSCALPARAPACGLTRRVCSRPSAGTKPLEEEAGGQEAVRGGSLQPGDPGRSRLEGSFWGAPREARPCHALVLD